MSVSNFYFKAIVIDTSALQLVKLYERGPTETISEIDAPASVVHHFLLAICSHRGSGICFADQGWYPRTFEGFDQEEAEDANSSAQKGGKIYNKILSNVLKMLKVTEDATQMELALKILEACPELVAGYLSSSGLNLDPSLTSRWLANISFLGSVVSLQMPFESFYLPADTSVSSKVTRHFRPHPPPLSVILSNIIPFTSLKSNFTKGLQSTSALVQHTTAIVLSKCLVKFGCVLNAFRKVELALEEDGLTGQWSRRRQDLETEVRKRLPEFQVIVAFSQQTSVISADGSNAESSKAPLLAEVAERLLSLYHQLVPTMVSEVRFEVGKILRSLAFHSETSAGNSSDVDETGLTALQQMHVLQILRSSTQFSWSAKVGEFWLRFAIQHALRKLTMFTFI